MLLRVSAVGHSSYVNVDIYIYIYIVCIFSYCVILSNMNENVINKVQISSPELGDSGFPAPVQRFPFTANAAAPNAYLFRDPAAVFSASELK